MTTHSDSWLALNDDLLAVRDGQLTAPERHTRRYLAGRAPRLAEAFDAALPGARLALLQRLTAALMREGVLVATQRAHEATIALAGGLLSVPIAARRAFGRLDLAGPPCWTGAAGPVALTHPLELLALLEGPAEAHGALAAETTDGCANLAMARAFWGAKREHLGKLAGEAGAPSALAFANALKQAAPCFSAATFFERLCVEGHLAHPGAKTRLGLSPEAVFTHGPEFDGRPALRFMGVLRQYLRWAGDAGPDDALMAAYPGLRERLAAEFADRGFDADEYGFVPVHPWQLEKVLPSVYRYELDEAIVVPARLALPCEATAAFRTLSPHGGGPLAFKVAVDAQMTSTVRSISPQTALNAPRVTALMRRIFDQEPARLAGLQPVDEVAGVCFQPADHEPAGALHTRRERNLTAVYRTNVTALVGPGEVPIVGTALYAASPVTGRPIASELMAMGTGEASANARAFVRAYAEAIVPGALTLLTAYGVGLEAHMQNCVPVFNPEGRLLRVLIRDWGGVRLHRGRLAARNLLPDLEPGSLTIGDDLEVVRAKLFYTLFQSHLGEIVALAATEAGEDESDYWAIVREVCRDTYRSLGADPLTRDAARADWAALTAPTVPHKALARMRLGGGGGDRHVEVPNVLHGGPEPW